MLQATLLFITGLTLSGVAIYYSVAGLGAIFAGALVPIYIMGTSLEIAKLVAASWLKANWSRAPWFLRLYMFVAIAGLMAITSIGVFGYLSKAHIEQSSSSSGLEAKLLLVNSRIAAEQSIVDQYRSDLSILNEQISKFSELGSVSKGVAARAAQQEERTQILDKINASQTKIADLQHEKEPIEEQLRSVEAEVGPIKYIAAFFYGDNPNASTLEKAVTWLIILIVVIFDPLAIAMLLAAQLTFNWTRSRTIASTCQIEDALGTKDTSQPEPNVVVIEEVSPTAETRLKHAVEIYTPVGTEDNEVKDSKVDTSEVEEEDIINDVDINAIDEIIESTDSQPEHELEPLQATEIVNKSNAELIAEEAKRYSIDESKKKTYMIKDPTGQTSVRIKE